MSARRKKLDYKQSHLPRRAHIGGNGMTSTASKKLDVTKAHFILGDIQDSIDDDLDDICPVCVGNCTCSNRSSNKKNAPTVAVPKRRSSTFSARTQPFHRQLLSRNKNVNVDIINQRASAAAHESSSDASETETDDDVPSSVVISNNHISSPSLQHHTPTKISSPSALVSEVVVRKGEYSPSEKLKSFQFGNFLEENKNTTLNKTKKHNNMTKLKSKRKLEKKTSRENTSMNFDSEESELTDFSSSSDYMNVDEHEKDEQYEYDAFDSGDDENIEQEEERMLIADISGQLSDTSQIEHDEDVDDNKSLILRMSEDIFEKDTYDNDLHLDKEFLEDDNWFDPTPFDYEFESVPVSWHPTSDEDEEEEMYYESLDDNEVVPMIVTSEINPVPATAILNIEDFVEEEENDETTDDEAFGVTVTLTKDTSDEASATINMDALATDPVLVISQMADILNIPIGVAAEMLASIDVESLVNVNATVDTCSESLLTPTPKQQIQQTPISKITTGLPSAPTFTTPHPSVTPNIKNRGPPRGPIMGAFSQNKSTGNSKRGPGIFNTPNNNNNNNASPLAAKNGTRFSPVPSSLAHVGGKRALSTSIKMEDDIPIKRIKPESPSLALKLISTMQQCLEENELTSDEGTDVGEQISEEDEPSPLPIDELVDTRTFECSIKSEESDDVVSPDESSSRYLEHLDRWERVPIGAFRRSRNPSGSTTMLEVAAMSALRSGMKSPAIFGAHYENGNGNHRLRKPKYAIATSATGSPILTARKSSHHRSSKSINGFNVDSLIDINGDIESSLSLLGVAPPSSVISSPLQSPLFSVNGRCTPMSLPPPLSLVDEFDAGLSTSTSPSPRSISTSNNKNSLLKMSFSSPAYPQSAASFLFAE